MRPAEAQLVFHSLTSKQHETLALASSHLTSKQIARKLGVAPVTIDKRIEGVRARLGSIPRSDLLRLYNEWRSTYDRSIDDPIILGETDQNRPSSVEQPPDPVLDFSDSLMFDGRASWERDPVWLRPGLNPSDLGASGKILAMLGGAVAIMMVAVLSVAFADAFMSFV